MDDLPAIRASDAEREAVAVRLREAAVEGRLTLDELALRLERAYGARTAGELEPIVSDLPAAAAAAPVRRRSRRRFVVSVMGGTNLRGRFRTAKRMVAIGFMGGSDIDLRLAEIDGDEVTIYCLGLMGAVGVVVPEGVEVDETGFALMGGRDVRVKDVPPLAGTPLVRVRSLAVMGGTSVRSKPHLGAQGS
ncbi:MAG TPA: DUF1707 domain-containing protein [Gaiellaceae bacterium]|nr:DUF1707 domain-containing protein [Gaiellaceae bacterium]